MHNLLKSSLSTQSEVTCFFSMCIRCLPQRDYPRPRLSTIRSPQGSRPPSYFWPGGWPLGALPSLPQGQTRPPRPAGEDQESQAAVWSLYGVWREPDVKRDRPKPGALLQSSMQPQTQLLPLLMGRWRCGECWRDCTDFTSSTRCDADFVIMWWCIATCLWTAPLYLLFILKGNVNNPFLQWGDDFLNVNTDYILTYVWLRTVYFLTCSIWIYVL